MTGGRYSRLQVSAILLSEALKLGRQVSVQAPDLRAVFLQVCPLKASVPVFARRIPAEQPGKVSVFLWFLQWEQEQGMW